MIAAVKTIEEVMSRTVLFAKTTHSFSELCRLFFEMEIHHLPVVGEDGRLIGMLSSNDALKAFSFKVPRMEKFDEATLNASIKIEDMMTPQPLITIGPEANVWEAAHLFKENNIHALPVVKDEKVVGIITSNDFIGYCASLEPNA